MSLQTYKTFSRGIHVRDFKEETNRIPIKRFPFAPLLILPLKQHIGRPSIPVVREDQEVLRGQVIAKADGHMSVPLHAPVSGIVKKISRVPFITGEMVPGIYLQSSPGSTQEVLEGGPCELETSSPQQILNAIQAAGIVGLGGAMFPTHVKLQPPAGTDIDTLIVNGVECEPFLTTDHRVMLEQTSDLVMGIRYVLKATGAKQAVIAVEANKMDAVQVLRQTISTQDPVSVQVLAVKYPQGAEKLVIKALLNREVPPGGHAYEMGVVGINVATAAEIGRLLPHGRGIQERVVTIGGTGVAKKGNYRIPIGTPLRFVLENVEADSAIKRVILGGPMMGVAVADLDISITKGIAGIFAFNDDAVYRQSKVYPCIHCGYCVNACPMGLNPSQLGLLAMNQEYDTMANKYFLSNCFECGACSFVCPSHIPLVQYFCAAKYFIQKPKVNNNQVV